MSHRIQVALCFLASGLSLMFITLFAVFDKLEPLLRGGDPSSAETQALLAEIYPFEGAAEVRAIYGILCMIPILAPILSGNRIAAWITLVIGALTTLINLQDAVAAYLLNGAALFGAAFLVSVGTPAIIGVIASWRWARGPA